MKLLRDFPDIAAEYHVDSADVCPDLDTAVDNFQCFADGWALRSSV